MEDTEMFEFTYSDGTLGGIMLEQFDENCSGVSKNYAEFDENNIVKNINNKVEFYDVEYPYVEENIKAKIMYGLGYEDVYENIIERAKIWDSEYLNTTIDDYCTVDDFSYGLQGNNFIAIEEHGSLYNGVPVICTQEVVNEDNMIKYKEDLNKGNIVIVTLKDDESGNSYYWIKPSFFAEHYDEEELDGAIVYLGCCYGYKTDDLVKSFKNAGADCVIGNSNSVYTWYNTRLQDAFVYSLLYGDTVEDALNYAKDIWGRDDYQWAKEYLNFKDDEKETAETKIYCGNDVKLVNLVQESDDIFEKSVILANETYNIKQQNKTRVIFALVLF